MAQTIIKYLIPVVAVVMFIVAVAHVVRSYLMETNPSPPPSPDSLKVEGVVEPAGGRVAVAAPSPGIVASVSPKAKVGARVEKGDVLFCLDDASLRAQLRISEARRETAVKQLDRLEKMPRPEEILLSASRVKEAEAHEALQKVRLDRGRSQYKGKLIVIEELEQLVEAHKMAQEQLERAKTEEKMLRQGPWEADKEVARAAVAEAEAGIDLIHTELERLTVRAPISGTVLQVNVQPGEAVGGPGVPAPFVLGDLTQLQLRVEIPEDQMGLFRAVPNVEARRRGQESPSFPLRLVRVEPVVAPRRIFPHQTGERGDSRVFQVIYDLEPGSHGLHVGQRLDVTIPL